MSERNYDLRIEVSGAAGGPVPVGDQGAGGEEPAVVLTEEDKILTSGTGGA